MTQFSSILKSRIWLLLALALVGCPVADPTASDDLTEGPDVGDTCTGEECDPDVGLSCREGHFDPELGVCGQCLNDVDCPSGYCHPSRRQCVACYLDAQCKVGVCEPERLLCVECLADGDCASGDCDEDQEVCRGCGTDADCDDKNACTSEHCVEKACLYDTIADGAPCEIDACREGDSCLAGKCSPGDTVAPECKPCESDAECPDDAFCRFATPGACGGGGRCALKPVDCDLGTPVCGCDDKPYSGECAASAAGINVLNEGLCACPAKGLACAPDAAVDLDDDGCPDACACGADVPCAAGTWCDGECGGNGACVPVTAECAGEGIVCGCDGETWSSACAAQKAGHAVKSAGKCCAPLTCQPGMTQLDTDGDGCVDACECKALGDCALGQTCRVLACGEPGLCQPCTADLEVCGCDGHSYASDCDALTGVAKLGACCVPLAEPCQNPVDTDGDGCADLCACSSNGDCKDGLICTRPACDSTGLGLCRLCADAGPVCGCDGATWPSGCAAAKAGIGISHGGECQCATHTQCADGQFCRTTGCGETVGACRECQNATGPVCGCNGETFATACEAAAGQTRIAHDGVCCVPLGCPAGKQAADTTGDGCPDVCTSLPCDDGDLACPAGSLCTRVTGVCGGPGLCEPLPTGCVAKGVCGCDGKTWKDRCAAAAAGIGVASEGACCVKAVCAPPLVAVDKDGDGCPEACEKPCESVVCAAGQTSHDVDGDGCGDRCPCLQNGQCGSSEYCARAVDQCDNLGVCELRPTACPAVKVLVCGCNNFTYTSECAASQSGVNVAHLGECCVPVVCGAGSEAVDLTGDGCSETCLAIACKADSECGSVDLYCERSAGACGSAGTCAKRPASCLGAVASPVCGCDGASYASACHAAAKSVSVASTGACKCKPVCAVGDVPVDANADQCADGCVPKCANACDCETATGGLPKVECTNVCPTCKPAWVCEQGACLATCGTTDTCL